MASRNDQHTLEWLATHSILHRGSLYKKSLHHVLLRCVDKSKESTIIEDIDGGECGPTHEWAHVGQEDFTFGLLLVNYGSGLL